MIHRPRNAAFFLKLGVLVWPAGLVGCSAAKDATHAAPTETRAVGERPIELAEGRVLGALPDGTGVADARSGVAPSQMGDAEAEILKLADRRVSTHELIVAGNRVELVADELVELVAEPFEDAVRGHSSIHEKAAIRTLSRPAGVGRVVQVEFDEPRLMLYITDPDRTESEAVFLVGTLYYADVEGHVFRISLRSMMKSPRYPESPPALNMRSLGDWLGTLGSSLRPGRPSGSTEARTLTIRYIQSRILVEVPRGWFIDYFDDDGTPFVRIIHPAPLGKPRTYVEIERGFPERSNGEARVLTLFGTPASFTNVDTQSEVQLLEYVEAADELSLAVRLVGASASELDAAVSIVERMRREPSSGP